MNKSTTALEEGDQVLTTEEVGTDFGLPLVEPWKSRRYLGAQTRIVRGHCKVSGGTVVWFEDGTKSRPIHGRTAWILP